MYTYRMTPSALRDLQEIADYIALQLYAPESAAELLAEVEHAIEAACEYPLSVPPVGDALLRIKGYRKIIVRNYIVFVIADQENEQLNVMRVMYHARNYLYFLWGMSM